MRKYKLKTKITSDGKIILPKDLGEIFNHKVEVFLFDLDKKHKKNEINIPTFSCGGKKKDFNREELYENRI